MAAAFSQDDHHLLAQVERIAASPEAFAHASHEEATAIKHAAAALYGHVYEQSQGKLGPRRRLAVEGMDPEQIWLQLDSQARGVLSRFKRAVSTAKRAAEGGHNLSLHKGGKEFSRRKRRNDRPLSRATRLSAGNATSGREGSGEREGGEQVGAGDGREEAGVNQGGGEKSGEEGQAQARRRLRPTEDDVFKIDELEQFLNDAEEAEEKDREREDERQLKQMNGGEGEEEEEGEDEDEDEQMKRAIVGEESGLGEQDLNDPGYRYEDLFGSSASAGQGLDNDDGEAEMLAEEEDSDGEGAGEDGGADLRVEAMPGTTFETVERDAEERAKQLEEENIGEKEWYMQGEAKARDRPKDSALEMDLDYEHTQLPAPEITEEHTRTIEDAIKERIKERRFDDVIRIRPEDARAPTGSTSNKVDLDPEKSSKGLGQIYEEEYVRQAAGTSFAPREEAESKLHSEARQVFSELCAKLDAMSHLHHHSPAPGRASKGLTEEPRKDEPALKSEDALPYFASKESAQTPEEAKRLAASNSSLPREGERRQTRRRRLKRKARRQREEAEQARAKKQKATELRDAAAEAAGFPSRSDSRPSKATKTGRKRSSSYVKSSAVFASLNKQQQQNASQATSKKAPSSTPHRPSPEQLKL